MRISVNLQCDPVKYATANLFFCVKGEYSAKKHTEMNSDGAFKISQNKRLKTNKAKVREN